MTNPNPNPKPLSKSLTVRAAAILLSVVLARMFAKYVPGELAHELATGVADEIIAAICTALAGVVVYGRKRAGIAASTMLILLIAGCGGAWPAACLLTAGGSRACHCGKYRIVEMTPPGAVERRFIQACDDAQIPVVILAESVTKATR